MARLLKKFALILILIVMMPIAPDAAANPAGDFFKKIGRSISHLGKSPPPSGKTRKMTTKDGEEEDASASKASEKRQEMQSTTAAETPVPTPVDIRPAAVAAPDPRGRRDVPYGVAVPNKPGFVASPYAPTQGFVDVRAFPSSTEVLDPFTGKIFLTP
jgi:hypothetical protein